MKSRSLLILTSSLTIFVGCSKQNADSGVSAEQDISNHFVIQESDIPDQILDYSTLAPSSVKTKVVLSIDNFAGCSYKLSEYPFESASNIGAPVIDLDRYAKDNPHLYIVTQNIGTGGTKFTTFAGFNRYEEKTTSSNMVESESSISLMEQKAKNKFSEIFNSTENQINSNVFGVVNVNYYNTTYNLVMHDYEKQNIMENYIFDSFKKSVYYCSSDEFIDIYGGFVLRAYTSGARLTALFSGTLSEKSLEQNTDVTNEAHMEAAMKQVDWNTSSGTTISSTDKTGKTYKDKFTSIEMSVITQGGVPPAAHFTIPTELSSFSIDLSAWNNSIGDKDKMSIVMLPERSLIPLTDFIEEDNLKDAILKYYENGPNKNIKKLQVPHIEAQYVKDGDDSKAFSIYLVTRYGDKVLLGPNLYNFKDNYEKNIKDYVNSNLVLNGHNHLAITINYSAPAEPLKFVNRMLVHSKFIDPDSGKVYILLGSSPGFRRKTAFTLYDRTIINRSYGFADFLDSIPTNEDITLEEIRSDYRLIAL